MMSLARTDDQFRITTEFLQRLSSSGSIAPPAGRSSPRPARLGGFGLGSSSPRSSSPAGGGGGGGGTPRGAAGSPLRIRSASPLRAVSQHRSRELCQGCFKAVIWGTDVTFAYGGVYHAACFTCHRCSRPINQLQSHQRDSAGAIYHTRCLELEQASPEPDLATLLSSLKPVPINVKRQEQKEDAPVVPVPSGGMSPLRKRVASPLRKRRVINTSEDTETAMPKYLSPSLLETRKPSEKQIAGAAAVASPLRQPLFHNPQNPPPAQDRPRPKPPVPMVLPSTDEASLTAAANPPKKEPPPAVWGTPSGVAAAVSAGVQGFAPPLPTSPPRIERPTGLPFWEKYQSLARGGTGGAGATSLNHSLDASSIALTAPTTPTSTTTTTMIRSLSRGSSWARAAAQQQQQQQPPQLQLPPPPEPSSIIQHTVARKATPVLEATTIHTISSSKLDHHHHNHNPHHHTPHSAPATARPLGARDVNTFSLWDLPNGAGANRNSGSSGAGAGGGGAPNPAPGRQLPQPPSFLQQQQQQQSQQQQPYGVDSHVGGGAPRLAFVSHQVTRPAKAVPAAFGALPGGGVAAAEASLPLEQLSVDPMAYMPPPRALRRRASTGASIRTLA